MNDNFYKQLIEESQEGYAYHKIICNGEDIPCDYEFIEANVAFEKYTGLVVDNIVGRKVTEILPGFRDSNFDWIKVYGDIAINGGKGEFMQFSEHLERWCQVKVYSPEKYFFITQFSDISKEMIQMIDMQKLSHISEQFLQLMDNDIDYQKITEEFLEISGAKFAIFNLYDEDGKHYYSKAIAGDNYFIKKAHTIMGIKLKEKKWNRDEAFEYRLKDNMVSKFSSLEEFVDGFIPETIIKTLEKKLIIGEIISIKILKNDIILGYFILFMQKGKKFEKKNIAEIYSRQLGLVIARKRAEKSLWENDVKYRSLFDSARDAILVADAENMNIIDANKHACQLMGYTYEELMERKIFDICPHNLKQNIPQYISEKLTKENNNMLEIMVLHKDGRIIPVEISTGEIYHIGDRKVATGVLRDITERKQNEQIVERLAYYDTLTGLPNRTKSYSIIEQHIKNHKNRDYKDALLFIDIDNFKYINDTFGHLFGDKILIKVSQKLKTLINERIQIARVGGDEFIVFYFDTNHDEVEIFAKTILSLFSQKIEIEGNINYISVSIGISIYPDHATNYEELLQYANMAMYEAKSEGKAGYVFFNASLHEKLLERVMLESQLRLAIENNELILNYQPQLDLKTGKISGLEALVRWNSPKHGIISPSKFIPLAEEIGLIIKIGAFVLRTSAIFAKKLQALGYSDLTISVNISVKQMNEKGFVEKILAIVKEYGVHPSAFTLEITESVLIESFDIIREKLSFLRDEGFNVSLDDFGTGYSSLTYLRLLPINSLKIDKYFIDGILTNNIDNGLTGSIIQIAHQLGLSVVAEGVELEGQYQYLYKNQCDSIQGYYFSEPLSEDQVLQLLYENLKK